ncbi:hypothetical protein HNP38_002029 [Chryseobacterium defluvii]|uniref:Uncharacterized protein n=1 Tax=Chryseobacterium defluvii TaxID=160396 RepID=A0A840KGT1_9FLAO|nr:hypothetical protein [Chryseobacterium defluvii]MBB4806733.1 hypothetical protein [Chryseobacterium defluvii]
MSNIGKIIRVNALPPQEERETNVLYQVAVPGTATYTDYAIDKNGDARTPVVIQTPAVNAATIDKPDLGLTGNVDTKQQVDEKIAKVQATAIKGKANPASNPTPYNATTYPNGLYEKWEVDTAGTYTNFKDASNNAIVVTADHLNDKLVTISVSNGISKLDLVTLPSTKIETWSAQSYPSGKQVFHNQKIYESNAAATSANIPGQSSVWIEKAGSPGLAVSYDPDDNQRSLSAKILNDAYFGWEENVPANNFLESNPINCINDMLTGVSSRCYPIIFGDLSTTKSVNQLQIEISTAGNLNIEKMSISGNTVTRVFNFIQAVTVGDNIINLPDQMKTFLPNEVLALRINNGSLLARLRKLNGSTASGYTWYYQDTTATSFTMTGTAQTEKLGVKLIGAGGIILHPGLLHDTNMNNQPLNTYDSVEFAEVKTPALFLTDIPTNVSNAQVGQIWLDVVNGGILKVKL